jgi:hypothetical protein
MLYRNHRPNLHATRRTSIERYSHCKPPLHVAIVAVAAVLAGCSAETVEDESVGLPAPTELLLEDPSSVHDFDEALAQDPQYAGVWVEDDDLGNPVIYVGRTSDTFEPIAPEHADAPIVYVDVDYSLQELNAEFERLLEADRVDAFIAFGAYVDAPRNRIAVQSDLEAEEVLGDAEQIAGRTSVNVDMIVVDEPTSLHEAALAGGHPAGGCTGGFAVKKYNQGTGKYMYGLLTAGHCGNSAVTSNGCQLKKAIYNKYDVDTGVDRQIHKRAKVAGCKPTTKLGNGVRHVKGGASSGHTGQKIARYGKTTGTKKGKIHTLNWYFNGNGPWILSTKSMYCQPGDSGGPWYTRGTNKWPLGLTYAYTSDGRCVASKVMRDVSGTGWWIY